MVQLLECSLTCICDVSGNVLVGSTFMVVGVGIAIHGGGLWHHLAIVIHFCSLLLLFIHVCHTLINCFASLALRLVLGDVGGASHQMPVGGWWWCHISWVDVCPVMAGHGRGWFSWALVVVCTLLCRLHVVVSSAHFCCHC